VQFVRVRESGLVNHSSKCRASRTITSREARKKMRIETLRCNTAELKEQMLPRLAGNVFHVTTGTGFCGIRKCRAISPNVDGRYPACSSQSENSYGRSIGSVCLMDLRCADDHTIADALDRFYFLDPFTTSRVNVFLLLRQEVHSDLIPNKDGRGQAQGRVIVPRVEVWYPRGCLPISAISLAIKVHLKRPGKWDHIDMRALRALGRERGWFRTETQ
jgi:hypothetical protein